MSQCCLQDIYNVRPLPYIIGTKSYVESADAGLGGIGGFEEDEPEAPAPAHSAASSTTARTQSNAESIAEADDASDSGSFHEAPARRAAPVPTSRPAPVHNTSNYDYDDGDEDVDETFVNDDSTIASGNSSVPPPPRVAKPTGNPLKDMLNAQIAGRSSMSAAARPSVAAAAGSSNWDDADDDEESTAEAPANQQRSLASVVGRAPTTKPPVTSARKYSDDLSVQSDATPAGSAQKGAGKGAAAATSAASAAQAQEDGDDDQEEEDLFSANDDPFGLFGSSKPSAFARVSDNCFA